MATLAAEEPRVYEAAIQPEYNDLPIIAADVVYSGAACGESSSTGTYRPLVAGDAFGGFAIATCDNSAGAASALNIRARTRGIVKLTVVGAASAADKDATVYASDDATFTLTSGSNTAIGKVARWVSSTTCMVRFEAASAQSL